MSTLLALPVLASLAAAPAEISCEGWTTRAFWETVDPATASDCLANGYSVDDRSEEHATPLHLAAAFSDDPAVIRILVEAGASLEASSPSGRTPLHFAARYSGNAEVVRELLRYGTDVYARNEKGRTPLHLATLWNENPPVVEELARMTHIDVRGRAGATPLHEAARRTLDHPGTGNPNPAIVEVLLRHGADLSLEAECVTVVRSAGDPRVAEMIRAEEARREAIREQFLRDVTTRVAVGTLVLGLLAYLLGYRRAAQRRFRGG